MQAPLFGADQLWIQIMKLGSLLLPALCAVCLATSARAEDVVVIHLKKAGNSLAPVVIELFERDAPAHAANFKNLVSKGFYNDTRIHRVVSGALVQMGDPLSRRKNSPDLGTGGPGYTLPPEIKRTHATGIVGMGRLPDSLNPGRLSNGSQFYVTLKALPELDGTQTVFGHVVQGMETFEQISSVAVDSSESPIDRITIGRCKVVSKDNLARELKTAQTTSSSGEGFWKRLTSPLSRLF